MKCDMKIKDTFTVFLTVVVKCHSVLDNKILECYWVQVHDARHIMFTTGSCYSFVENLNESVTEKKICADDPGEYHGTIMHTGGMTLISASLPRESGVSGVGVTVLKKMKSHKSEHWQQDLLAKCDLL